MKKICLVSCFGFLAGGVAWWLGEKEPRDQAGSRQSVAIPVAQATAQLDPMCATSPIVDGPKVVVEPGSMASVVPLRQDLQWKQPISEPTFAEFKTWADSFPDQQAAGRVEEVLPEGIRLAKERRMEMADMIDQDPQRALQLAVPETLRRMLPPVIVAELEEPVKGRGDLWVAAAVAQPGKELLVPAVQREVAMKDGRNFKAFTFGKRKDSPSRLNIAVQGIALDGKLALRDLPGRVAEPVEAAELKAKESGTTVCPTSGLDTTANGDEVVVDWDGNAHSFYCGPSHATKELLAAASAEAGSPMAIEAAAGGGVQAAGLPVAESGYTEGTKKMLIIRVDFPDKIGQVVSDATLTTLISNFATHWSEMSYGKTTWATVGNGSAFTPTLRLPLGHASYTGFGTMLNAARAAAEDAGYNYTNYNFDVVVTGDKPDVGFGGIAFVGGRGAWLANGQWNLGVGSHEVGHNFGLNHAGFWDTTDGSPIGDGSAVEYGNPFDHMGGASSSTVAHFGARQKNYLDWLPDGDVKKVTANGTYTNRISACDKTNATGARAIAVDRSGTSNDYWIEYRQAYASSNKWMKDGVVLNWGDVNINNGKPLLLDLTPTTSTLNDCALLMGQTFSDTAAKVHITPVAKGADANGVTWMDVTVNRGDFAGNTKPTVNVTFTPNNPAVNATATFTATASDPNGDPLSYYWDWGGGLFTANNSPTATNSWTSAGIKTVRCLVSDMKGLVATGSVLVQVGTTSTFYISGYVKDASNNPLSGVTVRADATHSDSTDSEGYFAITDLAAGSYTVSATKSGLQFVVSGFTNPVAVGPSKQNINFNALPGAPAFGIMKAALVDGGSTTGAIPLPLTDPDTAATALTLTGTSSNSAIIPNTVTNISFGTVGAIRTVTVTAPANVTGTVDITLTATDGATTATYVWPVTVNSKPVLTVPTLTTPENTPLAIDLRTWVTDDFTSVDKLLFQASRTRNGSLVVQPDGHTGLFTPAPDFDGTASFQLQVNDQSLSSRTLFLWDFEPPDITTDSKGTDLSNYNRRASYQAVGNGEFAYVTTVPPALSPHSQQALSLTENGLGNAARATVALSATDLNINDADWTFAAWMRRVSNTSEDFVLHLGDGDGHGTKEELSVYFTAGSDAIRLAKFGTAGLQKEVVGPALPVNEWHHIAVTYDRTGTNTGTLTLYVDGFPAGSATGAAMALSQAFPLVLGGTAVDTATTDRWFDGLFDDVTLIGSVSSTAEIRSLAKIGTAHQVGLFSTATVNLTVTGANQPPVNAGLQDVGLNVSQASAPLPFNVADAESEARTLVSLGASNNQALLPNANIVIAGGGASAWTNEVIGTVNSAGALIEDHGTFIVSCSGADIWGTADEFRFVHQPLAGDGELVARLRTMDFTHEGAKAGLMLRESNAANSAYAMVMVMPGLGVSFQSRLTAGATATENAIVKSIPTPCWLKLNRTGGNVSAFYSVNGTTWVQVGTTQAITISTAARLGLAVTSKVDGTLTTAEFDQLSGSVKLGGERTVTLNPVTGQIGTATVTISTSDGTNTTNSSFLAVIGQNTPPTITDVTDVVAGDGETIPSFTVTLGDLHTAVGSLVLSGSSSNSLLLPANRITFSGTGATKTVNVHPVPGETGTVTVTLTVSDGVDVTNKTFTLTVLPGDPSILVPAGGNWKYLDTGSNPSGWQQPAFADGAWLIGPGQLGFGESDQDTVLNPVASRISTYFRRTFQVPDPYAYSQLKLRLLRDDGAVIYINGQEVLRSNMPQGIIAATTQASAAVSGVNENLYLNYTIKNPPLVAGTNVIAVSLHQSGTTSSDLSFDLEVQGTNPQPVKSIATGSIWKYLDDGTDPGATWKDVAFVEPVAWKSGPAQLGYGDTDEATVINGGPTTNRFTTSYFRQSFVLSDVKSLTQAVLYLLRDDGAVIYLNGTEVIRDNMPAGTILSSTKASSAASNADETLWRPYRIDPSLLLEGTNVIAAEVHQSSATSTDVSFDLKFLAYPGESIPPVSCTCTPTTIGLDWPAWAADWKLMSSSDLHTWTIVSGNPTVGQGKTQLVVPRAGAAKFYRLVAP